MKKFEYKVLTMQWSDARSIQEIENALNLGGRAGWELVSTSRDDYPNQAQEGEVILFIFKKEVE